MFGTSTDLSSNSLFAAKPAQPASQFTFSSNLSQPQFTSQTNPLQQNPLASNPLSSSSLTSNPLQQNPLGTNPLQPNQFQTNPLQIGTAQPVGHQQQQQHQVQQQILDNIFAPKLFNDERDQILGQFNKVQAYWGVGKAYYAVNTQPLDLNQHLLPHRFKAIGFSEMKIGEDANEHKFGVLVEMEGNETQLNTTILQYESNLKLMFGVNYAPKVETTKTLPHNRALLTISVMDINTNIKLPAKQLILFLNQPNVKSQLNGAFLNKFVQLIPLHAPSKQEIEEYLRNVPQGIDQLLWNQAKLENPDPKKFIPVPLIGFAALNERFKLQEQETHQQRQRLKIMVNDIENLERNVAVMRAKLEECKRRNVNLGNRVLSVIVWQEIRAKRSLPVQAEEDQLRAKLESIQSELNAPTKFKGCLNEIMCRLRQMRSQQKGSSLAIDESVLKQVKAHLAQEQDAIKHLLSLVKTLPEKYNLNIK